MGTRASFWKGDPRDLKSREWLGCKAWDGYPDGIPGIEKVKDLRGFNRVVKKLREAGELCDPAKGWPYPWADDIFLTDYTYAFFDGKLWVSCYHGGLMSLKEYSKRNLSGESFPADPTCLNVPAPLQYNPKQPDSIIVISRQ